MAKTKKTLEQHIFELSRTKENAINSIHYRYKKLADDACKKIMSEYEQKWQKEIDKKEKRRDRKIEQFKRNFERKEKWNKIVVYVKKKKTLPQLWKERLELFQERIRLIDTNIKWFWSCITCNCPLHRTETINGKKAHAGHGKEARFKWSALMRENLNIQCNWCNLYQYKTKDLSKYETAVNLKYWAWTWDNILLMSKEKVMLWSWEYTREKLLEKINRYKEENKRLKALKQC